MKKHFDIGRLHVHVALQRSKYFHRKPIIWFHLSMAWYEGGIDRENHSH